MAPAAKNWSLEREDKSRDASFSKVLHGNVNERGGFMSMLGKDSASKKEAVDEYFKHWDNKNADVETEETRKARRDEYATLTKQYVNSNISTVLGANGAPLATTTLPLTSTSTAGAHPSTSAASPSENRSTKPSPVTSTTLH
jgi:hypothetical protein